MKIKTTLRYYFTTFRNLGAGGMPQQLRAVSILQEDLSSIPNIQAKNCLQLLLQGIHCPILERLIWENK